MTSSQGIDSCCHPPETFPHKYNMEISHSPALGSVTAGFSLALSLHFMGLPHHGPVTCLVIGRLLGLSSWHAPCPSMTSRVAVCPRTSEDMPDQYRDLKLCVLFCGAGDVRIIAEVQIHDAVLYALKLKVSLDSGGMHVMGTNVWSL